MTTSTSGLMSVSVFFAESTLRSPIRSMLWRIWRCRLDSSTTSMSMMPIVPTPAAARYSAAGEPRPPAPSSSTLDVEQLLLAGLADLGQEQVALVAVALLGRQRLRHLPVAALVLPLVEPAGDRDHVGVAEVVQRLGRERRAGAAGAVDDDGRRLVAGSWTRPGSRGALGGCGSAPGRRPGRTRRARARRAAPSRDGPRRPPSRRCRPRGCGTWSGSGAHGTTP